MNAKRTAGVFGRATGVLLACAVSLAAATARAEEPASAAPTENGSRTDSETSAVELFRDAETRYAAGDVAGALESMQRSYDLSGRPELLFNLGELHRELAECGAAVKAYDEYLVRTTTQGRHREEARRWSTELADTCPEEATPVTMPPIPAPPPPPVVRAPVPPAPASYWTPARIGAWSALGVAVAAAAGATYAIGRSDADKYDFINRSRAVKSANIYTAGDASAQASIRADGSHANTWAYVLGIGAAGFAATGVTLLLLNPVPPKPAGATVTVRVGAGVSVNASF